VFDAGLPQALFWDLVMVKWCGRTTLSSVRGSWVDVNHVGEHHLLITRTASSNTLSYNVLFRKARPVFSFEDGSHIYATHVAWDIPHYYASGLPNRRGLGVGPVSNMKTC
jgi:hypothetical protein